MVEHSTVTQLQGALQEVRFGTHSGPRSDIAPCPKSASLAPGFGTWPESACLSWMHAEIASQP
jgi:hypothetical protein